MFLAFLICEKPCSNGAEQEHDLCYKVERNTKPWDSAKSYSRCSNSENSRVRHCNTRGGGCYVTNLSTGCHASEQIGGHRQHAGDCEGLLPFTSRAQHSPKPGEENPYEIIHQSRNEEMER